MGSCGSGERAAYPTSPPQERRESIDKLQVLIKQRPAKCKRCSQELQCATVPRHGFVAHVCNGRACGHRVLTEGFVYRCDNCDYDLCISCAVSDPAATRPAPSGPPDLPPTPSRSAMELGRNDSSADSIQTVEADPTPRRTEPAEGARRALLTPSQAVCDTDRGLPPPQPSSRVRYVVARQGALVREGEDISSQELGVLPYGSEVLLADSSASGTRVQLERPMAGWVSVRAKTTQVEILSPEPNPPSVCDRTGSFTGVRSSEGGTMAQSVPTISHPMFPDGGSDDSSVSTPEQLRPGGARTDSSSGTAAVAYVGATGQTIRFRASERYIR
eukprot:Hpha_TRINITY_DN6219_c0_g1::TRINITY_DN6219_c0_g1_i1::g.23566::m.23566